MRQAERARRHRLPRCQRRRQPRRGEFPLRTAPARFVSGEDGSLHFPLEAPGKSKEARLSFVQLYIWISLDDSSTPVQTCYDMIQYNDNSETSRY